jgi:hypothetical protein
MWDRDQGKKKEEEERGKEWRRIEGFYVRMGFYYNNCK